MKHSTLKYILLSVIALVCGGTADAIDMTRAMAFKNIIIPYVSVDNENNPVVLSERIFYPTKSASDETPDVVQFVVLYNHPTVCANFQAPTGEHPIDASTLTPAGSMGLMASEHALVIISDYLGYGYSRDKIHPYCNHTLTAKNVLDGYVAAMDTIKARGIQIADDYYTISVGYSQGGSTTMAVQKYLETEASQEVSDLVRLKHSYCGAGPYDLPLTYKDLAERDTLSYSCSLPMTIEGIKAAYNEGCMKQVDLDDIYISKEFREGIEALMNSKEYKDSVLNKWIKKFCNKVHVNAADIIKADVLDHSSAASRAMDKALSKCNLLDGTWIPKTPITMFQFSEDDVVPFANSQKAKELFGDKVTLLTEKDNLECTNSWMALMEQMTMPKPKCHLDYGTTFIIYFLDGILREK